MNGKQDYYEVLGLARDAAKDDIKTAYRKAALKYHPDRNKEPEAETKFKEATEAYEVLSDNDRRSAYDHFGHDNSRGHWTYHDPIDIFRTIFSGGFADSPSRNRDCPGHAQLVINLTLEEVAKGVEKQVSFTQTNTCSHCSGKGGKGSSCYSCGGAGGIQQNHGPFVSTISTCPYCNGLGIKIEKICCECQGKGIVGEQRTLTIKMPVGVKEGEVLRIRGKGNKRLGSNRGDIICHIRIKKHPIFERHDNNLVMVQMIDFVDAVFGSTIEVPTIYGEKVNLFIHPGTQAGQILCIPRQGIPGTGFGQTGDQLVQIQIDVPKSLTPEAAKLLREYRRTKDSHD